MAPLDNGAVGEAEALLHPEVDCLRQSLISISWNLSYLRRASASRRSAYNTRVDSSGAAVGSPEAEAEARVVIEPAVDAKAALSCRRWQLENK